MELYTVKVEMTVVLATPNDHEPTDKDIAKAIANEIECNGFMAGKKKVKSLKRKSKIPKGWDTVLPWTTKKSVNKDERYVKQILDEDGGLE